jgi:eukaryotic-like serine/threonine-protein kinase
VSLATGTRLGPYEVLGALGAGGMGEVYRARDTRLDRDVAIKILPQAFAADADRLARFEREAKTLASLNHPHIAQIHGIEDTAAGQALVMELVEGEDLSARIGRGALPLGDAIAVARQIAEALEAAHERGVIHRDLKPANVKLREDGMVKVLDFGLAKALDPSTGSNPDLMNSPTITSPATQLGMILGTAAYMAPEQAKGRAVDRRADVWAFGVVLYEMLTGRRAFDGADISEVLASVLKDTPSHDALPPGTPAAIRRLLRRCLEKNPAKRLDSMAAARLDLDEALDASEASGEPAGRAGGMSIARVAVIALAAAAAASLAGGAAVWRLTTPPPGPVQRLSIAPPKGGVLHLETNHQDVAITPDGSQVIYWNRTASGVNYFQIRPLAQFEGSILDAEPRARGMFLSPDGAWIGFQGGAPSGEGAALMKVAIGGGTPALVARLDANLRGASWGADDTILFATARTATGLHRVKAAGGTPEMLTTADGRNGEIDHLWPHLLPGGTHALFVIRRLNGPSDIGLLDLEARTWRVLVAGGTMPRYAPTGHIVYATGGMLNAIRFDLKTLATRGEPVRMVDGVVTKDSGAADFDISTTGTLVYMPGSVAAPRFGLTWIDRAGTRAPLAVEERQYRELRISPDGRRVAATIEETGTSLWVIDLERQTVSRLTPAGENGSSPVWSPDNRWLVYQRTPEGGDAGPGLFRIAASGTTAPEPLTAPPAGVRHTPTHWSADGRDIFFVETADRRVDVMRLTLESGTVTPVLSGPEGAGGGQLSPDGRWLAYVSQATGRFEVYIRPYPNVDDDRVQVTSSGARAPSWTSTGTELIVLDPDGDPLSIPVSAPGGRLTLGKPSRIVAIEETGRDGTLAIAPDGTRFLIRVRPDEASVGNEYRVVLNWFNELKARVK